MVKSYVDCGNTRHSFNVKLAITRRKYNAITKRHLLHMMMCFPFLFLSPPLYIQSNSIHPSQGRIQTVATVARKTVNFPRSNIFELIFDNIYGESSVKEISGINVKKYLKPNFFVQS